MKTSGMKKRVSKENTHIHKTLSPWRQDVKQCYLYYGGVKITIITLATKNC